MGTTAITVWNSIVSPLYDAAERIMFVFADGTRDYADVGRMSIYEKAELLAGNATQVLICGAISEIARAVLIDKGILVQSWTRGKVEEVLRAYADGALASEFFRMPGCGGGGQCRRIRRRGEARMHKRCRRS